MDFFGGDKLASWQTYDKGFFNYNGINFQRGGDGQWRPISLNQNAPKTLLERARAYANIMNTNGAGPEALLSMGGGTNGLSAKDLLTYSQNRMGEADFTRIDDEADLAALEKDFSDIPNQLKGMYADKARAAGTYAETNEFRRGLDSDVQAGARGAQALLSGRINALRTKLGREPLEGTAAAGPTAVTDNPSNLTGDKSAANADMGAAAGTLDGAGGGMPDNLSNTQDTANNAVTSLQSRTATLKKKVNSY